MCIDAYKLLASALRRAIMDRNDSIVRFSSRNKSSIAGADKLVWSGAYADESSSLYLAIIKWRSTSGGEGGGSVEWHLGTNP